MKAKVPPTKGGQKEQFEVDLAGALVIKQSQVIEPL